MLETRGHHFSEDDAGNLFLANWVGVKRSRGEAKNSGKTEYPRLPACTNAVSGRPGSGFTPRAHDRFPPDLGRIRNSAIERTRPAT